MQTSSLSVLALNPYDGGSQRKFFEDWARHSRHRFSFLRLPPRHFKWRMRQAAVYFAGEMTRLWEQGNRWDVLLTTALMNSAELRGLIPAELGATPLIVYFHENQPRYPVRKEDPRDVQFSFMNWTSALAATQCWFNSNYNRSSFMEGMREILRKMPDHRSLASLDEIATKSRVLTPGIEAPCVRRQQSGPLHIAWVARWEYDKNPDDFVAALERLHASGVDFRVSLLGQYFSPTDRRLESLGPIAARHVAHAGFVPDRCQYWERLSCTDVVVSTAQHEFFGVAMMEAVAVGCIPVAPRRLVYPELYPEECLYGESVDSLCAHLSELARAKERLGTLTPLYADLGLSTICQKYHWTRLAPELDTALADVSDA